MNIKPKALIITGDGLNCEKETAFAFEHAGAQSVITHIHQLLDKEIFMKDFQIAAFVGGFSNGDHLGAGIVQAFKFRHVLKDQICEFTAAKKPVIGICNGFQTMVKMGLLPGFDSTLNRSVTLMHNDSGKFEDRWVHMKVPESVCIWTKAIKKLYLPVRHGEGKLYGPAAAIEKIFDNRQAVLQYTDADGLITDTYPDNPNGSLGALAGICNISGTVFGLMPHPEAALFAWSRPDWQQIRNNHKEDQYTDACQIFKNGVRYAGEM